MVAVTSAMEADPVRRSVPGITVRRAIGTTTPVINDPVEAVAVAAAAVAEAATEEVAEITEEAPVTTAVTTVTGVAAPAGTAAVTTTTAAAAAEATTGGTSKMWWSGKVYREAAGSQSELLSITSLPLERWRRRAY